MNTPLGVTASYIYAARYGYSDTVVYSDNRIRLFPRSDSGQTPLDSRLWTSPAARGEDYRDRFGNSVRRVQVSERHEALIIAGAGRATLASRAPQLEDRALADLLPPVEALEFVYGSPLIDPAATRPLALEVTSGATSLFELARLVTEWVNVNVSYRRGATDVATTAEEVMLRMEGVCQDQTHLAIGMLRSLDLPCRYVSGLLAGQTGETHAWLEFLHPGGAWIVADPTRNVVNPPPSDYVKMAVGRDYTDVSPVSGSFRSSGAAISCAAIAAVSYEDVEPTFADALRLLDDAHVVANDGPWAQ